MAMQSEQQEQKPEQKEQEERGHDEEAAEPDQQEPGAGRQPVGRDASRHEQLHCGPSNGRPSIKSCLAREAQPVFHEGGRENVYNGQKIEGREGLYVEKYSIIDKYARRIVYQNRALKSQSAAQFFKMYTPHWPKNKNRDNKEYEISDDENIPENTIKLDDFDKDSIYSFVITEDGV